LPIFARRITHRKGTAMSQQHGSAVGRSSAPGRPYGSKNTDKARLSRNRRRDVVENDEYAAFARRILRAYAGSPPATSRPWPP
jgi:hypothetical protein